MNDSNALGQRIHADRQAAGQSVDAVATATRTARATIYRIENGENRNPSPQLLGRIARALGTEVEDYLALAGHYHLPDLPIYLRTKYGVSPETAQEVADYLDFRRQREQHDADEQAA